MSKSVIAAAVLLCGNIALASNHDTDHSGEDGEEHVHYVDPSMDGHCVACIGARRIFCMDGKHPDGNGDLNNSKNGTCQPSWAYCTNAGR